MNKRLFPALASILVTGAIAAQQMPVSENYFMDKYSLSPSYAGHFNPGTFVTGFRSDWTGIKGGPKTLRLSYSDMLTTNAAYGGRIIYDRAGIFDQLYIMGTYSYNLHLSGEHNLLLALSAGFYHNRINFSEYYNDPRYNIDPVMTGQDTPSKLKFMSDFSAVWLFRKLEAGILFTNITFGNAKYGEVNVTYKPFAVYQFHAAYSFRVSDNWNVDPLIYLRGGKFIRNQAGIASRVIYRDNVWIGLSFRDPYIWGTGFGVKIAKGINFSYQFNFASAVAPDIYNNHEVSIGINIKEMKKEPQ